MLIDVCERRELLKSISICRVKSLITQHNGSGQLPTKQKISKEWNMFNLMMMIFLLQNWYIDFWQ